ncbi:FAD-binding oxidoreductase [Streptomyces sp. PA03-1a]|nr:FAD-binding oxidoreductase [Streptomyces sp. PA03-1a]
MQSKLLTGWGRTAPTRAHVLVDADDETLAAAVRQAGARGLLARGAGRAYGDAGQNAGGLIANMSHRTRITNLDVVRGIVTAEAGVTINGLLRSAVPLGWCLPVIPGTGYATVGGAIAADVHGKNHSHRGSFGSHIVEFDLLTASGKVKTVTPQNEPEVFWATVGGMGLTGIVLRVTMRLIPVRTAWMRVIRRRVAGFNELLTRLDAAAGQDDHTVAWVDLSGCRIRGVVSHATHAETTDLPARYRSNPLSYHATRPLPGLPVSAPLLVSPKVASAANSTRYALTPPVTYEVQPLSAFCFPLDRMDSWNRVYGRRGFLQYQFVVPEDALETLRASITILKAGHVGAPLAVLKRLGPGNAGLLSFPAHGWTLAADLAVSPTLAPVLDRLDQLVAKAGGRVYLAKDARLSTAAMADMYPRLPDFRVIRRELDPAGVFVSDLARRLSL